jgi:hypothetical protein
MMVAYTQLRAGLIMKANLKSLPLFLKVSLVAIALFISAAFVVSTFQSVDQSAARTRQLTENVKAARSGVK